MSVRARARGCVCVCVCVRVRECVRARARYDCLLFIRFARGDSVRLSGLTNSSFDYFAIVPHDSEGKKCQQRLRFHETNSLVNSKFRGLV